MPRNDDGFIDFEMFEEINVRFPMILFPSFHLQDNLQQFTLGTAYFVLPVNLRYTVHPTPHVTIRTRDGCCVSSPGRAAWLRVHEDIKAKHRLMTHRRLYNGALPARSFFTRLLTCGHDPRFKRCAPHC